MPSTEGADQSSDRPRIRLVRLTQICPHFVLPLGMNCPTHTPDLLLLPSSSFPSEFSPILSSDEGDHSTCSLGSSTMVV